MNSVPSAALYAEPLKLVTAAADLDLALQQVNAARSRLCKMSVSERAAIVRGTIDTTYDVMEDWVRAGCEAKGLVPGTESGAEETQTGPLAMLRYLRLLMQSLQDIDRFGTPCLPGAITTGPDGHLRVRVVPTRGLFDAIAFQGFQAMCGSSRVLLRTISPNIWPHIIGRACRTRAWWSFWARGTSRALLRSMRWERSFRKAKSAC